MVDTVAGALRSKGAAQSRRAFPLGNILLGAPAAAIFLLLFVVPLGRVFAQSLETSRGIGIDNYLVALDPARDIFLTVVGRTAWIAALVTLACVVIGYAVAYLAVRLPRAAGIALVGIVCLPFFSSALVRSYSWQVILGNRGPINEFLLTAGIVSEPLKLVYNDVGVVIGMTQVLLPMMVFPAYTAMLGIDRMLVDAARSMGSSSFRAWRTVFLPLSVPGVVAGAALVFIVALGYYTTPVLLQGPSTPMFAQRIDSLAGISGQGPMLATQSILMLLACVVLLVIFRRPLGLVGPRAPRPSRRVTTLPPVPAALGALGYRVGRVLDAGLAGVFWPVVGILSLLAMAGSLAPIAVIGVVSLGDSSFLQFPPRGFSTRWYEEVFSDPKWLEAFGLSLGVAALAAVVVAAAAAAAAYLVARSRRAGLATAAYAMLVAPLVVPQILIAIALLTTMIGLGFNGTPGALVLGYLIITLPLAMILMTTAFRGLDPLYERASASLGATPAKTARWVVLPLVAPAVGGALLFSFVTGFSDLVMAQFLGGPRAQTLERLIFRDIRESVSPEIAAVGTLLVLLILLLGVVTLTARRILDRRLRG